MTSPSDRAPTRSAIGVVIADDHAVVRCGIRAFLETEGDLVVLGEAADGAGLLAHCRALRPDVAVVDLMMPGGGIEAIRALHLQGGELAIVVLSSAQDLDLAQSALAAGALSFLHKDVAPEDLAQAIRLAARGQAWLQPRVAAHLVGDLQRRHAARTDPLSLREREVLLLIAQGLSNQRIAAQLGIGEKTVKTHVGQILAKLGLVDRTQVAIHAWREGWIDGQTPALRPAT